MAEYEEKDVKVDFFKTVFLISDKQLQDIGQKFQSVLITFDKCFKILENNISENIFQNYRLKCEKIKSLSKYATELARNGWLISYWFGLSEIDALSVIAYSNNFIELEKKIKEFYEEDIYDQAKHMIEKYPKKEFILGPAIEAHKRGEYALSILAFFVIADGICRDNTGREIFQGYPEKRISAWAKEKFHEIDNAKDKWPLEFFRIINLMMFEQIIEQLPVMYNANKRIKNDYSGLNRNTFLHGLANKEDATKENSLKAFSLLSYIASFLNEKRLNFITSIQDK